MKLFSLEVAGVRQGIVSSSGRATGSRGWIAILAWLCLASGCRGAISDTGATTGSALANDFSDSDLIEKSLMIRDPSVVDSPEAQTRLDNPATTGEGRWSFAHIIESISGSQDPRDVTLQFLSQLVTTQTVNGFPAPPVLNIFASPDPSEVQNALDRWCRTSDGKLDLTKSPFRLLAVVNRFDLRQDASEAGELRFIFNLLTTDDSCRGVSDSSNVLPAVTGTSAVNIIFEFSQPTYSQPIWGWIVSYYWRMLSQMPFGSTYDAYLSWLTDRTVMPQSPSRPNSSQINQVRTNQGFSPSEWVLHEFRLGGATPDLNSSANPLLMVSPAAQPDFRTFNNSPELAAFVQQNSLAILAGTAAANPAPATFLSKPFAGAESRTTDFWTVNGNGSADFAFQTCGGCHTHGTSGPHVGSTFPAGREVGQPAQLSFFLSGGVPDSPSELGRRAALLKNIPESFSATSVDAFISAAAFNSRSGSPGDPIIVNSVSVLPDAGSSSNRLGLYAVGDPDTSPVSSIDLTALASLTTSNLTAPSQPGTYEVRYFTAQGRATTSAPLHIELNTRYSLSYGLIAKRGATLFCSWSAPGTHQPDDRLALYGVGDPDGTPLWSQAAGAGNISFDGSMAFGFLSVPMPLEPGSYELRYFRGGSDIKTAIGQPIQVQ